MRNQNEYWKKDSKKKARIYENVYFLSGNFLYSPAVWNVYLYTILPGKSETGR